MQTVKSFKATLNQDICYCAGPENFVNLKRNTEIRVEILPIALISTDENGKQSHEPKGAYIGVSNGQRFDLEASEFKTID